MTDTVLVLAATGKTGRRLVPKLAQRGVNVRAASRQPGEGRTLFDWNRPDTHQPALVGADAVYLVPPELVEDPTPVVAPFLDLAARAGVSRLVALSSLGVEFPGEPTHSGRRQLEQQILQSPIPSTILRPTGFAQNFSEGFLLPGVLTGTVMTATADGAVAFIDADDIAAVAATALTQDGHANTQYALTGPQPLTAAEALATISQATGRPIIHKSISEEEMAGILGGAGVPDDYTAMLLRDMQATRDGSAALVTDVVERVTGRPAGSFADYATRTADAWNQR